MGITVAWHNAEKTIIRLDYTSPWTWNEFVLITRQAIEMARAADRNVGIISQPSMPSPKGNPIPYFSESLQDLPDNLKTIAIVGSNYFTTALTKMGISVFSKHRNRLFIAYSLRDAEAAVLKRINESQPV